ncbi:hypothetical protein MNBD_GAMMA11-2411 [hydrothermal vent metagenome]|uniref:Uncharacterized protein n=1 Tax=hydrothermal vent metagenome TaxID=652676 RepID=A0A3B0WZ43_9ZZZZ
MKVEKPSLTETFSADKYLINIIRRAVSNAQNILIDRPQHGHITVLANDGEYFAEVEHMPTFCSLAANEFKVTVLNEKKLQNYKTGIGRNIDELLWQAGYYASGGRLMEGCGWNDVVKLNHWPNLTRLPATPNALRIAALLAAQPTTIEYTILSLKIKRHEVYQFYCAARCSGVISTVNETAKEPVLRPHRSNALISLLLSKIARI